MSEPEQQQAGQPRRSRSRVANTVKALLRTRITAGLLVVLPIWVTILLVKFVFGAMRDASLWAVEGYLRSPIAQPLLDRWKVADHAAGESEALISVGEALNNLQEALGRVPTQEEFLGILPERVEWGIAIVSVLLTIIILYAIGLFAKNIFGRRVIASYESLLDRVPLVKTVYRSSKQILATFAGEQSEEFQRAALVPFPQEKMRSVGFITAIFNDSVTGEELAAVFIPTTPNPTTGYLQVLKRKELVELDWSVEDAVRTIMSGGILRPDFLTIVPGAQHGAALPQVRQPELNSPPDDQS